MPGRTFTREVKLEIVRQLATGAKRPAQVGRAQGRAESVLARWRREYAERGAAAFAPKAPRPETRTAEARIAELERFCGQVALEHAVLKQALQSLPAVQSAPSRSVTPGASSSGRLFPSSRSDRSVAGGASAGAGTRLAPRARSVPHALWCCAMRVNAVSWSSLATATLA
jgi:transposase